MPVGFRDETGVVNCGNIHVRTGLGLRKFARSARARLYASPEHAGLADKAVDIPETARLEELHVFLAAIARLWQVSGG